VELKQVIVVRRDLGMGTGKIAAQVAHASLIAARKAEEKKPNWFFEWFEGGQAKVVVKVQSLEQLMEVKKHADSLNLPVSLVHDSGRTQLDPGTVTCVGIGPAPEEMVDKVTNKLKLL
jgi:peptidyl-tRNA hydrolase, PTH2 family